MMKITILSLFLSLMTLVCTQAQTEKKNIYNPDANAKADINQAIEKASQEKKHVLIQVGGNWCPWCLRFHAFIKENASLDSIMQKEYVYILVNYSKENPNNEIMKQLEYPNRFGFPVLVILDGSGRRIHTQDTSYLEEGKTYSKEKILAFLKQWTYKALHPDIKN